MTSFLRDRTVTCILLMAILGIIWGLIEIILGGFLHAIHLSFKGVVLGGIGISLMASFVLMTQRPGLVLWLGVIAAGCKVLGAIFSGISPASPAVINPATAILAEALAFSLIFNFILRRKMVWPQLREASR